jgi:hypothetical protein
MTGTMNAMAAAEHVADLHRDAGRQSRTRGEAVMRTAPGVELRPAYGRDGVAVARLAALDDARELDQPVLLALVDGEPIAAISLSDRRIVANPFVGSTEAVALLTLRAEQLSRGPARRRLRLLPRLRAA